MIFTPIIAALTALLNGLYALLPPWTFSFHPPGLDGSTNGYGGSGASSDGGALYWFIGLLAHLDRWIPLHDAMIPIFSIQFGLTVGLLAFKVIKFLLSLIPTVSAGG